jgi:CRISPR-associated endonuclease/helicase Cas3
MPAPNKKTPTSISVAHEICWAKTLSDGSPGLSVHDHCLNVGCVAEALLASLPHLRALTPQGSTALAALHDVGKVSPGFQAKCPAWLVQHRIPAAAVTGCESDHARISQHTLQGLIPDSLRWWAAVVGAHHGKIKGDRIQPIAEDNHASWAAERERLVEELTAVFGALPADPGNEATRWTTAGLITVADWIGSDENLFPQMWTGSLDERRQRARSALAAVRWESPTTNTGLDFAALFPRFEVNALQAAAWEQISTPGLYVIEGPMGCGKTEAALAAAYRLLATEQATGVYFALPTQVTSNRIHLRVGQFLTQALPGSSDLHLIHSGSWLLESALLTSLYPSSRGDAEADEHVRAGRSWFASAKRAILAPFGVGTIDQALLGIVAAKHFFVRQLGLAGKIVILDEVHTYDLYTSTLIDALIKRLLELRCTVIVLSATLTRERRRQLLGVSDDHPLSDAYPLVSGGGGISPTELASEPPPAKSVAVCFPPADTLIESALERAQRGECVLWIRNTVADAQETFAQLKSANREGGPEIAVLHSRFPQFRRQQLEDDWLERLDKTGARRPRNGCVLLSTQVAEQSVDIDADLLITDLAPTDMLLQRLGRLWRHERARPCEQPETWIRPLELSAEQERSTSAQGLQEALGKSARVYAPYVLLRSWQQWNHRTTITLPHDIRAILEATYAAPTDNEPPAWSELRKDLEIKRAALGAKALNATNVWFQPPLPDDEGVQTRYSNQPTASLLVAREIERTDAVSVRLTLLNGDAVSVSGRDWNIEVARALHRNLVRMPRWAVNKGLGTEPDWLHLHVAQPTAIGLLQYSGAVTFWPSEDESGLSYCSERGILIVREKRPATTTQEKWDEDESYD